MDNNEYRDTILDAVNLLEEMQHRLFNSIINTGMKGVHNKVEEVLEVGDEFYFELAMFEDTGDKNLDLMIELIKRTARCKNSLMNLNAISEDEVKNPEEEDWDE